jgi:cell fate (sporulation/competence/biofilm development) regulator YlbF (YheA/YmcA/DUF963 family)
MKKQRDFTAYLSAEKKMEQMEKELNQLIEYPPFSDIDEGKQDPDYDGVNPNWGYPSLTERGIQLQQAVRDSIYAMNEETKGVSYYEVDPSVIAKCYVGVFEEFKEDLDEARLYQKRYPEDSVKALKSYKRM